MRAVLQRVTRAEVRVDGVGVGAIAEGLCVLLAVREGDGPVTLILDSPVTGAAV